MSRVSFARSAQQQELDTISQIVTTKIQNKMPNHEKFEYRVSKRDTQWVCEEKPIARPPASPEEFPNRLGPFGVLEAKLNLQIIDNGMYRCQQFTQLANADILDVGTLSPKHQITLSRENKRIANIPANAATFSWAYPLAGTGSLTDAAKTQLATDNPALSFLVFGGFIYFDKAEKVLQTNAIAKGQGLHFSQPHRWRHEFQEGLVRQQRFQPITIHTIHDQGARYYCWILPDEVLFDDDGCPWQIFGNGAFVYLFSDNMSHSSDKDRYFVIEDTQNISQNFSTCQPIEPFSLVQTQRQQAVLGDEVHRDESTADTTECVVCQAAARRILLDPCCHMCLCENCSPSMTQCPICRQAINRKLNVFM